MVSTKPGRAAKPAADDGLTQPERFARAACELECDDDPERFAERVRKLVKPPLTDHPSKGVTPPRGKE